MATFRQRKGRWQAIIRRVDLKATKTFDRLVDAKSWARAQERAADVSDHMPGKMPETLAPLIERYETEVWPMKRWGTSKANDLKVLKRDLGSWHHSKFTKANLLAYLGRIGGEPSTKGNRIVYLKEVFKTARDLWGMGVPLAQVEAAIGAARRLKIIGKSRVRTRRPTADELAALLGYERVTASIDLAAVVRVLSVLPLRLSELLRIQWDDLNAERRTAIVRGRKHPDALEKEHNDQEVPLITFGGVDTYALIAGRPRYMESPFPYKANSVSTAFINACSDLGIKDLHLHDFRAHAASALLEGGIPIPQVALLSGHRNWKILARVYARIDPLTVHETINRAGQGTASPTSRETGGGGRSS